MKKAEPANAPSALHANARRWLGRLAVYWGLFLVYGTTLPFDLVGEPGAVQERLTHAVAQAGSRPSVPDLVSNLAVFFPFGLFLGGWLLAATRSVLLPLPVAGLAGFVLSVAVEGLQLLSSTRVTDANDVVADTAGSVAGALAALVLAPLPWHSILETAARFVRWWPRTALALLMTASIFLVGLSPYDLTIDVGNVKDAVKRTRLIPFGTPLRAPPPPSHPWKWVAEGLEWTLAGAVLALALQEHRRSGASALKQATLLGALSSAALEGAQLFVRSRGMDMTSTLMAALGCAAGAALVVARPAGGFRTLARAGLLCWAAAIALERWAPFEFSRARAAEIGWLSLVPFLPYLIGTQMNAAADMLEELTAFVPIGALLVVANPRRMPWQAALIGLVIGVALEAGQAFLPRTPDVTDAISAAIGAALGAIICRRALQGSPTTEPAARDAAMRLDAAVRP